MMVGMLVLAQGIDGITEASQTRKDAMPRTRPCGVVTA